MTADSQVNQSEWTVAEYEDLQRCYGLFAGITKEAFDALTTEEKNRISWGACLKAPSESELGRAFERWLDEAVEAEAAVEAERAAGYEAIEGPLDKEAWRDAFDIADHSVGSELGELLGSWLRRHAKVGPDALADILREHIFAYMHIGGHRSN